MGENAVDHSGAVRLLCCLDLVVAKGTVCGESCSHLARSMVRLVKLSKRAGPGFPRVRINLEVPNSAAFCPLEATARTCDRVLRPLCLA